jgi:hypothetical protein
MAPRDALVAPRPPRSQSVIETARLRRVVDEDDVPP